ncbi:hypothetical protein [Paenibacillus macquariensis]|uniref:Uncharacterized protein n=1 Tax=Paenibacillus macquariensis TaxID=948756 RepID=A0ABY1KHH5_9BACL|nr:hypothetical protein [Paenibacillus macquariensis]MEC0093430.1 hypothetical protein [Paenibacillus macquariensis]OAB38921.1 hypothetical protein PMSM_01150 [Paenibacillus macquariensis subsp. macquariensis]SIR69823.1 hypothetical protein SAMN05421578_1363 [Paenibacillus macquariensis]
MTRDDKDTIRQSIHGLLSDTDPDKLILKSLRSIMPSKRRKLFITAALFLSVVIYLFYFSRAYTNAIERTMNLIETVNTISLPVLGLAVTGYAIFQALANGDTLITMLKVNENEKSKFQEYNYFFLAFSILYIFIIIINFLTIVFLRNVSLDWHISFFSLTVNNVIYSLVMSIYFTFILNAFVEIKCFVYNLYQIFSTNASAKGITYLNSNESEK